MTDDYIDTPINENCFKREIINSSHFEIAIYDQLRDKYYQHDEEVYVGDVYFLKKTVHGLVYHNEIPNQPAVIFQPSEGRPETEEYYYVNGIEHRTNGPSAKLSSITRAKTLYWWTLNGTNFKTEEDYWMKVLEHYDANP